MERQEFDTARRFADTSFGRIAYVEFGSGPAAILLHAFALNGFQWRDALPLLAPHARCVALDLLGMGHTEVAKEVAPSLATQARMVEEVAGALELGPVHLVGNDTGGGVAQIVAVEVPERIRSLCLIDSEVHDNFPPAGLAPIIEAAASGELGAMFRRLAADLDLARSAMGSALYQQPEKTLTEDVAAAYLQPLVRSAESVEAFTRFVLAIDNRDLVSIEKQLRELDCPALVLWGEEDRVFPRTWADWLCQVLPRATMMTVPSAGLCWPEEQPQLLARYLREFWASIDSGV